jgi:hypothetical protein
MTESEWLTSDDPAHMLIRPLDLPHQGSRQHVTHPGADRKLRLWACAFVHHVNGAAVRPFLGPGDLELLEQAQSWADNLPDGGEDAWNELHSRARTWPVQYCCDFRILNAAQFLACRVVQMRGSSGPLEDTTDPVGAQLLREILGNPFRPLPDLTRWRTTAVLGIAGDAYQNRHWELLPVLADALEEAGCAWTELLEHLRAPGHHVLGCWGLDAVVGRN